MINDLKTAVFLHQVNLSWPETCPIPVGQYEAMLTLPIHQQVAAVGVVVDEPHPEREGQTFVRRPESRGLVLQKRALLGCQYWLWPDFIERQRVPQPRQGINGGEWEPRRR